MGQTWSAADATTAAKGAAAAGWPALMTRETLTRTMTRFPADKSVLGTRVRFRQSGGGWVEYRKLAGRGGNGAVYRRVDD